MVRYGICECVCSVCIDTTHVDRDSFYYMYLHNLPKHLGIGDQHVSATLQRSTNWLDI